MNEIMIRPNVPKSRWRVAGVALGLALLGAGALATTTPARADTWVYDGTGHRVLIRENPYPRGPVYYTAPGYYYAPGPAYRDYGYYYGYPAPGVAIGVPGFGLSLGF